MRYETNANHNQKAVQVGVYPFFTCALLGLCLFFGCIAFLNLSWHWPILWCLAASAATFVLTGYDKAVAGKGSLRVPELVLYAGAAIGGAPGLLLGMKLFRHKTRKASFQFVLVLIIVLQVALWHYFLRNL